MYIVQCILYNVQCTVYSVQWTLYSVQWTMYVIHCIMYGVQCTVYVHLVYLSCIIRCTVCVVCRPHYIIRIINRISYTANTLRTSLHTQHEAFTLIVPSLELLGYSYLLQVPWYPGTAYRTHVTGIICRRHMPRIVSDEIKQIMCISKCAICNV